MPGTVENYETNVIANVSSDSLISPKDVMMVSSIPQNDIPISDEDMDVIQPIISNVYDIRLLSGQNQFNVPISLTFKYSDEEVEGLDESKLQVWRYDNEWQRWLIAQPNENYISRDVEANSLTIRIDNIDGYFILSGYSGDNTPPVFSDVFINPIFFFQP